MLKTATLTLCLALAACGGGSNEEPSRSPSPALGEVCKIRLDESGLCPESEIVRVLPDVPKCADGTVNFLLGCPETR